MAPKPTPALPTTTSSYHILRLSHPPTPSYPTPSTHYLYIRPHTPKLPDARSPRSLFIVNTPIDSTEHHFRALFAEQLGGSRVESVEFETTRPSKSAMSKQSSAAQATGRKRKRRTDEEDIASELPEVWDREVHRSGSAAVVVFVDEPSMQSAFKAVRKAAKARTELVWGRGMEDRIPPLGSKRYLAHHTLRYPSPTTLQSIVDTYMAAFALSESHKSRALARARSLPDSDGFITVTRGGRAGPARNEEAVAKMEELRAKEEEKRRGMGGFYRFQVRERKRAEAGELVRRFREEGGRGEEGEGEMVRGRRNKFKSA